MTLGRLVLTVVLVPLVVGCGGGDDTANTETTAVPAGTTEVRVYWLREGKVWPALRTVEQQVVAAAALEELLKGPTAQERADLVFSTAIPDDVAPLSVVVGDQPGPGSFDVSGDLSQAALAQIVYTLTQFPTLPEVRIQGRTYTRADFENLTPAILVESPLPFEDVESPLRVTGTANTFEANFQYELTDTDGLIVDQNFVTATSGTGTRGTFEFTTEPFSVPFDGIGALIVFESSAKDGSRINLVEIPLRMKR